MTTKIALYDSIDTLPVTIWYEILKTGNLKLLAYSVSKDLIPPRERFFILWFFSKIKSIFFRPKVHVPSSTPIELGLMATQAELNEIWLKIQQQYYDEFGIDLEFEVRMLKLKRLAELNCEYILTGNRKLLNEIAVIELDIKEWGEDQHAKFYDVVDRMESVKKIQLDLEKMTVIRWGWMLKNAANHKQTPQPNGESDTR